jgi:urate oxidase
LLALEGTGAIHIEHRPAAADECTTLPGDREVLLISLTDVGGNFHPTVLERGAGWDFVLAHRRFLSVAEITFNNPDEPTIAHVLYRWAWRAELVGQLMQLSETPLNAQASFTRADGEWKLRDPGV